MVVLTIKHCLAESHDCRTEGNENGQSGRMALQNSLLAAQDATNWLALSEVDVDVGEVHGCLNGIQKALSRSKPDLIVEGLPAIYVIHLTVQLVRNIEGPMN